ncbi:MAG: hypothetical protein IJ192_08860 [Clostridia bacterium]|nr:hypothetical protein [Clostridia bacterium]
MSKKQIIKMICLNLAIVALNVILFSQGLIGLTLGEDALLTAIGVTVIVMSVIAFGYGNYTLLFSEPDHTHKSAEQNESQNYIRALEEKRDKVVFEPEILSATDQISRLENKKKTLDNILSQYFSPQEVAYTQFQDTVGALKELFYYNIKKILNRITIFDYKDYLKVDDELKNAPVVDGITVFSSSADAQITIYNEHIDYVRELVEENEKILLKLDSLLLEISRSDDINESDFEQMPAMQEINELISQTNFYQN